MSWKQNHITKSISRVVVRMFRCSQYSLWVQISAGDFLNPQKRRD